jgi:hypothetical protein
MRMRMMMMMMVMRWLQVYSEEAAGGKVSVCYALREGIRSLVDWLSDFTPREAPLRQALLEVLEQYYPAQGEEAFPLLAPDEGGEQVVMRRRRKRRRIMIMMTLIVMMMGCMMLSVEDKPPEPEDKGFSSYVNELSGEHTPPADWRWVDFILL